MGRLRSRYLIGAAILMSGLSSLPCATMAEDAYVPGEVLVKFKAGVSVTEINTIISANGATVIELIEGLNVYRLKIPTGVTVADMVHIFSGDPRCEYAEPNYSGQGGDLPPSDTHYQQQWFLNNIGQTEGTIDADIDAPEGWEITTGSPSILVAVLDTGIDSDHAEFEGRIVAGYDFVNDDDDPEADHPHGVQVSGIIAANADNNFSVAGIDHQVSILPIKVLDAQNRGSTSALIAGLMFAADQGAHVINMSLTGYPSGSNALNNGLQLARDAGSILIACAGNGGFGNADVSGPGASPLTISVGATDHNDVRANFSGTGAALDVVAPGVRLATPVYDDDLDDYRIFSGCSAATSVVSGITTLLLSRNDQLTHDHVRSILSQSAEDEVGFSAEDAPGRDDNYGYGRVNLNDALLAAELPPASEIDTPIDNVSVVALQSVDLAGTCSGLIGTEDFSYLWTFSDASEIEDVTVEDPGETVFSVPGITSVSFACTDAFGRTDPTPDSRAITVTNDPPDGVIDTPVADATIAQGSSIDFAGSGIDPDGHLPLSFYWNFSGAQPYSTEEDPGPISFDSVGTYIVTLIVSDSLGEAQSIPDTRTVTVTNAPPDSMIDTPPADVNIAQGASIDFAGTGTDPDGHLPLSYRWDYGGGLPGSSDEDPGPVRFDSAGSYIVSLTVTDSLNLADPTPDTRTITVSAADVRQSSGGGGGSIGLSVLGFLVLGALIGGRSSGLADQLSGV